MPDNGSLVMTTQQNLNFTYEFLLQGEQVASSSYDGRPYVMPSACVTLPFHQSQYQQPHSQHHSGGGHVDQMLSCPRFLTPDRPEDSLWDRRRASFESESEHSSIAVCTHGQLFSHPAQLGECIMNQLAENLTSLNLWEQQQRRRDSIMCWEA